MTRVALDAAKKSVEIESAGVARLRAALDGDLGAALEQAVATIRASRGRVIVSGMGKSGHIGRKVAATFASTGTPSFFLHPAEASHGDLGMVTTDDVVLAFSWSGETAELADLIEYAKRFAVPLRPRAATARWAAPPIYCCCCRRSMRPARTASRPPPRRRSS